MTAPNTLKQLEIRWVNLEPAIGAETRKNRPCVIIQSTIFNQQSRTILVAPLLPNHKDWLFAVNIMPSKTNGLDKPRYINLKQMRGVDKSRIGKKQGALEPRYFTPIEEALKNIFGLS